MARLVAPAITGGLGITPRTAITTGLGIAAALASAGAALGNRTDHLKRLKLKVLALAAQGMLNKQIARTLGIGEKTVKAHLGRVYERLGVTNRADAVAWALDSDVIDTDALSTS